VNIVKFVLTILSAFIFLSHGYADGSIVVSDDWIVAAPPNASVIAGYMTIKNKSFQTRKLIKVSSEHFKRIEIHRTEMHGDVMRMVPQDELEIPARGAVSLQPGNYHLMLIGPESVPKEGAKVNLILQFDNGETLHLNSPVRKATSGSMMRGSH
jgi:copper(I)-binding protein